MSKTIEISRDLLAAICSIYPLNSANHEQIYPAIRELKDLLAAPVVERQEPVAYYYREHVWATGLGDYVWREKLETERPNTEDNEIRDLVPLYTSPPAPVAVPVEVHQQLIEMRQQFERANFVALGKLLRSCLDKVKELNQ